MNMKIIPNRQVNTMRKNRVSVIIPCKNEAGTIDTIVRSMPMLGSETELIFVDGNSTDGTWEAVSGAAASKKRKGFRMYAYQQPGVGKWDAVFFGLQKARGDILMIYDADMSVPITDLSTFFERAVVHPSALIIGSRFVYPQERGAMRLLNHTGNIAFSWIFSLMLGSRISDTLCGTKVCSSALYKKIVDTTRSFRRFDPYGDFTLLLGTAKLHAPIIEVPVTYRARVYGTTKISRFRDGLRLLGVLRRAVGDFMRTRRKDRHV